MRYIVDNSLCVGCGQCVDTCPEVFAFIDEGVRAADAPVPPEQQENAAQAAEECPVGAISRA